jgi:hypothetical protein
MNELNRKFNNAHHIIKGKKKKKKKRRRRRRKKERNFIPKNLRAKKREGPRISEPNEWVSQFSWKKNKQIVLKLQKTSVTDCSVVHELE